MIDYRLMFSFVTILQGWVYKHNQHERNMHASNQTLFCNNVCVATKNCAISRMYSLIPTYILK